MTIAACRIMVERGDPDRFLVTRAAPDAVQARLWPLYAFNLEIARAPWVAREPLIAEMRLQWWRDALEEIGAGKPPRAHEVAGPLAAVIGAAGLPVALLDAMTVARRWDIWREPFAGQADLVAHIDATAGNLMWLAALALEAPPVAGPVVRDFAFGAGLAGWLQAVPELAARGCHPLPDGRPEAVAALARLGLARIADARRLRHLVPRAVAPALLTGWQAGAVLRRAAAEPRLVAAGGLGQSQFRRRGGLVLRGMTGRW